MSAANDDVLRDESGYPALEGLEAIVRERTYMAEQLGRMTYEQLDVIRHCRRCLEPYDRCVCMERGNRGS